MKCRVFCFVVFMIFFSPTWASENVGRYNPVWTTPSANSSESMPCGGGNIGLNVWVENGEVLFYMQQSGAFDENNTFLKAGRVRLSLSPNPLQSKKFRQELLLEQGFVRITAGEGKLATTIDVWVEVYDPVIHVEVSAASSVQVTATYENWRYEDRDLRKSESFQNSYKWAPPAGLQMKRDSVAFDGNSILFIHRNQGETVFDAAVKQQGLDAIKDSLFNPLHNLTSGGMLYGENFIPDGTTTGQYLETPYMGWRLKSAAPSKKHDLTAILLSQQAEVLPVWYYALKRKAELAERFVKQNKKSTTEWWGRFWNQSFIHIETAEGDTSKAEEVARNYQLFRYMLGCNAGREWPTRFNGGLFTVDPVFTNKDRAFTPDFRNWGGGTFTAQNQRLVYFSMLKSGDFNHIFVQLDFYRKLLKNAELRSRHYWGHNGACFTEQIENFGLPNPSEYGWKRPDNYDKGMEYNAWLEYQWDTALEFCWLAIQMQEYTGSSFPEYIPFIESCLAFFDEHYQYLARNRGVKVFDANGHLVLYPGSACETYKMATNASSTIAALSQVTKGLLALPEIQADTAKRNHWQTFLARIPPISYREIDGKTTIAPAKLWERLNNTEVPQLYPVFPWEIYGVGKPGLDTARNTYLYDSDAIKFRSFVGWKQDAIWAARLGLTNEAVTLIQQKLGDSGRRFPAFWGPGFDWVPDHNWGGSGMIALQDMLLQTHGDSILLFPAWPANWDVHFKLHAPKNTVVEARVKQGKIVILNVMPEERKKDVILWNNESVR